MELTFTNTSTVLQHLDDPHRLLSLQSRRNDELLEPSDDPSVHLVRAAQLAVRRECFCRLACEELCHDDAGELGEGGGGEEDAARGLVSGASVRIRASVRFSTHKGTSAGDKVKEESRDGEGEGLDGGVGRVNVGGRSKEGLGVVNRQEDGLSAGMDVSTYEGTHTDDTHFVW
jgi:hypothetical protein